MSKTIVKISDHAILRYIERVHGVDVETIREQMSKGIKAEILNYVGDNDVTIRTSECEFVVRDGTVVTVIK